MCGSHEGVDYRLLKTVKRTLQNRPPPAKTQRETPLASFKHQSILLSQMSGFEVSKLAVPAVCILICLLAYSSQLLFLQLDPGPLSLAELIKFNSLLVALWICYYRACRTDPGRVPQGWSPAPGVNEGEQQAPEAQMARQRWCRKCETYKPPRAHHCKTCGRYNESLF